MVTTSYARFAELQINLPQAGGEANNTQAKAINVTVDASEHYGINNQGVVLLWRRNACSRPENAAGDQTDPTIVINADAKAPHQSVINVMEAARQAGYGRITFTTQSQPK